MFYIQYSEPYIIIYTNANCTCMKKRYRGRKEMECIYVLAMGAYREDTIIYYYNYAEVISIYKRV